MDKLKIDFKSPSTICLLAGSLVILLATFLPAAKVSFMGISETGNLMSDYGHHGIFHLILVIAIVVMLVLDKKPVVSGLAAAEVIWAIVDIRNVASDVSDANKIVKDAASFGIGFFFLIIGALALVAGVVLLNINAKKNAAPAQPMQ